MDGVVVPLDEIETAKGISNVIRNIELRSNIVEYLRTHDYGNEEEVEKIYRLINK